MNQVFFNNIQNKSHIPSQRPTSEEILKLLRNGKEKTVDKIELFDLDDKLEFDPEKLDFEQIINVSDFFRNSKKENFLIFFSIFQFPFKVS